MKTQKIKYKLPKSKFFSMEFPVTQTLSAGMKWKENYLDVIEFLTSNGSFQIKIKASLPQHQLTFPEILDFSYCPIREKSSISFKLVNSGELKADYEWSILAPFSISPMIGSLDAQGTTLITLDFEPLEAMAINAALICTFGSKLDWEKSRITKPAKVTGIAKYSHIIVQESRYDFQQVPIGTIEERTIIMTNQSAVNSNFKIRSSAMSNNDICFDFSQYQGCVLAGKSMNIKIRYTPTANGMHSCSYFDIATISGNINRITASGRGGGPSVTLDPNLINFNDVKAHDTVTRSFTMKNNSKVPANYQFLVERRGTFKLDRTLGVINPFSTIAVQVKICPFEPINYHRRLYVLVDNQDTIYIDLLATCYDEFRRPATFNGNHLLNFSLRAENGLGEYGPELLEEMIKSGALICESGILKFKDQEEANRMKPSLECDKPYENATRTSEYFYTNTGGLPTCSLLDTYVDFGSYSKLQIIPGKIIRVANHSRGKMTCVWMNDDKGPESLFSVSPKSADIPSKSVVEFIIHFKPRKDNEFYGKQLECFCYFKSMRNFRLVNEDTFSPPWCLTPQISGNTFSKGEDTFVPKIQFGRNSIDFPPCMVDRSQYQLVRITNCGDTTVKFSFHSSNSPVEDIGGDTILSYKGGATFSVKPRAGVLLKNESRFIILRFSPAKAKVYKSNFSCYFNNSANNKYDIYLRGVGAVPDISIGKDDMLNFKPTCVGSIASRTFPIKNLSKTGVFFQWKVPDQYKEMIGIAPDKGYLQADEIFELKCTFVPIAAMEYNLKIPCYFYHEEGRGEKKRKSLLISGGGMLGRISSSPLLLDFSHILINTEVEGFIEIFNLGNCDIKFDLGLDRLFEDGSRRHLSNNLGKDQIEVMQKSRVLPARSSERIKVKLCLKTEASYEFELFYYSESRVKPILEQTIAHVQKSSVTQLVAIKATGVHPILVVRDIISTGSH